VITQLGRRIFAPLFIDMFSMGNNVWIISNQFFIMPVFLGLTAIFCTRHHSNDFVKIYSLCQYVHFISIFTKDFMQVDHELSAENEEGMHVVGLSLRFM
jgi:hypothetical protein